MNQQGRTLVEMLGVVSIIGVITISGVSASRWMMDFYRAGRLAVDVEKTADRLNELMDIDCDILAQGLDHLCKADVFPQGCAKVKKGGEIISIPHVPFNDTQISVSPLLADGFCYSFQIGYSNIPKHICERVCSSLVNGFNITTWPKVDNFCVYNADGSVTNKCTENVTMLFEPL